MALVVLRPFGWLLTNCLGKAYDRVQMRKIGYLETPFRSVPLRHTEQRCTVQVSVGRDKASVAEVAAGFHRIPSICPNVPTVRLDVTRQRRLIATRLQ